MITTSAFTLLVDYQSLSIWGSLMGMLGMIIALPLTTLMLSYYQRFIINREKIHKFEQTDNPEVSSRIRCFQYGQHDGRYKANNQQEE